MIQQVHCAVAGPTRRRSWHAASSRSATWRSQPCPTQQLLRPVPSQATLRQRQRQHLHSASPCVCQVHMHTGAHMMTHARLMPRSRHIGTTKLVMAPHLHHLDPAPSSTCRCHQGTLPTAHVPRMPQARAGSKVHRPHGKGSRPCRTIHRRAAVLVQGLNHGCARAMAACVLHDLMAQLLCRRHQCRKRQAPCAHMLSVLIWCPPPCLPLARRLPAGCCVQQWLCTNS
jgi:hypothetical protein